MWTFACCATTAPSALLDEPGELVHRGPLVALGYWNRPEETALRFRPLPPALVAGREGLAAAEIAVFSGDTVRRDAEGFLYFVGRRDEMIKTSGYRVSPTEVEEAVHASGLVREVLAVGVAHETLGQVIHVAAVAVDAADTAALLAHCRAQLPGYMVPAGVHWSHRTAAAQPQRQAGPPALESRLGTQLAKPTERRPDMRPTETLHGELCVGGLPLTRLAERVGQTPFYAYDRALLAARVAAVRAALPAGIGLHYAVKANPMPALVGFMRPLVDGLDVASAGEMAVALDAGADPAARELCRPGQARGGVGAGGGGRRAGEPGVDARSGAARGRLAAPGPARARGRARQPRLRPARRRHAHGRWCQALWCGHRAGAGGAPGHRRCGPAVRGLSPVSRFAEPQGRSRSRRR